MSLCQLCKNLTLAALLENESQSYRHHDSYEELEASASACECCNFIVRQINKPVDFVFNPRRPHFITLMGSGLHGISNIIVAVAGSKLRAYLNVIADAGMMATWSASSLANAADSCSDSVAFRSRAVQMLRVRYPPHTDEAFAQLQGWLADCRNSHSVCRLSGPGHKFSEIPSIRILDVFPSDVSCELRLVDSAGLSEPYVTLSYCWGTSPSLQTEISNLNNHKREIKIQALPKTLRDAIIITRRLGLRYLWIDALCIVQDDTDDWRTEAAKMSKVYRESTLTIAVTAASDKAQGFFVGHQEPETDCINLIHRSSSGAEQGHFTLIPLRPHFRGNVTKSIWNTRGWILQERLLSRRIIYYAKDQLYWECENKTLAQDNGPIASGTKQILGRSIAGTTEDWFHMVEEYTTRQLTKDTDKLIAIAGLAAQRRIQTNDEYYFGIWKTALPSHLLWYSVEQAARKVNSNTTPTWSWASVPGKIKHENWTADATPAAETTIVQNQLHLKAKLKMVSPTIPIRTNRDLESRVTSELVYDISLANISHAIASCTGENKGDEIGWAAFDDVNDADPSMTFIAALLSMNDLAEYGSHDTSNFILLRKCGVGECYERVGIGEIVADGRFEDEIASQLTVV